MKKTKDVGIRFPKDLYEIVHEGAKLETRSVAQQIVYLVKKGLTITDLEENQIKRVLNDIKNND